MDNKLTGNICPSNKVINLYDYFINNTFKNSSNDTSVIFNGDKLTYKKLYENIIKISNYVYLNLNSLKRKDSHRIIAVHLTTDLYLVSVLLAIHRLSYAYVPIDRNLPKDRLMLILNNSNPDCIITNVEDSDNLFSESELNIPTLHLKDAINFVVDPILDSKIENFKRSADSTACVLYTSGSTGVPKGVCLTHRTIINRLIWQWETFPIVKDQDVGIQKTSLNFVDHIAEIFSFILKGLPLVIMKQTDVSNIPVLIDTLYSNKVTYFVVVPSLLNNIVNFATQKGEIFKLETIRRWVCSGEELNYKTLDRFFNMGLKNSVLSNFYGSTEVTADVTYITFKPRDDIIAFKDTHIPIGVPINNSVIELFDENLKPVKLGEIGEMYASGECLAEGYLDKSKNDGKFILHNNITKFSTGDFAFISNNMLYYVGRKDTQIKIRGKRIDLKEIELKALETNQIEQFVPLVYENPNSKSIIGFYKKRIDCGLDEEAVVSLLIENFKRSLPDYMIPSKLVKVDEMPLLYNGKIDRKTLLSFYETHFNSENEKIGNTTFDVLSQIIKSVTNVTIGPNDLNLSLNNIGIDSLNAVDVYLLIESHGFKLAFNEFVSAKTLSELIQLCERITQAANNEAKAVDQFSVGSTKFINRLKVVRFSERNYFREIVCMSSQTYPKKSPICIPFKFSEDEFYNYLVGYEEQFKNSAESFAIIDTKNDKVIAGALLVDADLELKSINENPKFEAIINFISELEHEAVEELKQNGIKKILSNFLVSTNPDFSYNENIIIIDLLEDETIASAKDFGYEAIVTINAIKLTQDICKLKGYITKKVFQTNQFVYKGEKIHAKIEDNQTLDACVKLLN